MLGVLALAVILLVVFWDWDWFRPLAESQASAALGRRVTMRHFDVKLSRTPVVIADGVTVANPDGFPSGSRFATIDRLAVTIDAMAFIRHRAIVIPAIDVTKPTIDASQSADGRATWDFPALTKPSANPAAPNSPTPKIGTLTITDGRARVVIPKLRADFALGIATRAPADGSGGQIVVDAKGTYADQPVTGHLVGGAVLSLRDAATPYPIDLTLANGPTHVSAKGTVRNPLAFAGANIRLDLAGPDMSLLLPLIGIPLPKTPPYTVSGNLDYADREIRFHDFRGRVGSSDIGGNVDVDPTQARPVVNAQLVSQRVDLADLGGFIGSQPGRVNTPGQSAAQKQAVQKAEASPQFLPTSRIDLPTLKAADIHLTYHSDHIAGRSVPFDRMEAKVDIVDGKIDVHPVTLGVGQGQITADIALTPGAGAEDQFHTKADIAVQRVDLGALLAATHLVRGGGVIGGKASIESTGNSVSTIAGHGDGSLSLFMSGGNLSALLVDVAGLEFGNAILSALGIPQRATLECFVADFALRRGVLDTRTMILDTSEAVVNGSGSIDLGREQVNYMLRTQAKHFSIGSLPAPIHIAGTFKDPSIRPDIAALGVRAGAAAGLGILFPPAALLPTIQFGVGNNTGCERKAAAEPASIKADARRAPAKPVKR